MAFAPEEVWASMICDDELIEDDIMVLFGCSDVMSLNCWDECSGLRAANDVINCDDIIILVGCSDVMPSKVCDECSSVIKASTDDVSNWDDVIVFVR